MRLTLDLSGRTNTLAWSVLGGLCLWGAAWLAIFQPFELVDGTFPRLAGMLGAMMAVIAVSAFFRYRLEGDNAPIAQGLAYTLTGLKIFAEGSIFLVVFGTIATTLSYLGQSYNAPLQDEMLARMDAAIGFDWLAVHAALENYPGLSRLLAFAYASSVPQLGIALFLLAFLHNRRQANELLALLALTAVTVVVFSALWPAIGACPHHQPTAAPFRDVDPLACQWHLDHLMALRNNTFTELDLQAAEGLITFPSFHTMMAILTTYVLRGYWWAFYPALGINTLSVLSTVPYGGHHLVDIFGGAAITIAAIALVQWNETRAIPAAKGAAPAPAPELPAGTLQPEIS